MVKKKEISLAIVLGVSFALLLLGVSYVAVPNAQTHMLGMDNANLSEILPAVFGLAIATIVAMVAVTIVITIQKLRKQGKQKGLRDSK